jgi:tight adherence protein C
MADWTPLIVTVLAFVAMAGFVFVGGQYYVRSMHIRRRLPLPLGVSADPAGSAGGIGRFVARHFDEKRFGVDNTLRGKLRLNLVRAGYFGNDAVNSYVFWRLAVVFMLPIITYVVLAVTAGGISFARQFIFIVIAAVIGIVAPDAFISRRQRSLALKYRNIFPDFLDLVVVCIDAGLTIEGALDRITTEFIKRSRPFGINLALMVAEMQAGRTFVDALATLADRLMIPEARALVAVLRQSVELGSNIGDALRVVGDEMRDRRLLLAEEQANKLSVKMIFPLGLFIMPVVFMVIMLPLVVRLFAELHR